MLLEPTTILAKAWEQIERIGGARAWSTPRTALVTGAGPDRAAGGADRPCSAGSRSHVLDRVTDGAEAASWSRDLGATYHAGSIEDACRDADVIIECTGVGQLVFDAMRHTAPAGSSA